jgi:tRNA G18 (ribose-2'-O)-methylase SpoU
MLLSSFNASQECSSRMQIGGAAGVLPLVALATAAICAMGLLDSLYRPRQVAVVTGSEGAGVSDRISEQMSREIRI